MKKLYLILTVLLLQYYTSFAQKQWQWLNPQPSGFACLNVVFTDHQNGYILNYHGDLIHTANQGASWQQVATFPKATAMSIAHSTGVITTNSSLVYISSDNGNSWAAVQTPIGGNVSLIGGPTQIYINIVSQDSIFVGNSNDDTVYFSADRGNSWTPRQTGTRFSCMSFLNSREGCIGNGAIYSTSDGGRTWEYRDSTNGGSGMVDAIQFVSPDTVYAHRWMGTMETSYDGGVTWQALPPAYTSANCMNFVNSSLGYLGGNGSIYRISNNGSTTVTSVTPANGLAGFNISSIDFITADTGFAVGMAGRILRTTDSGNTWTPFSPIYTPVNSISFGSPSTGYAASEQYLYKTSDGGHTWDTLGLNAGTAWFDQSWFRIAHFTSADTGFVVQDQSVIIHTTTDGGQTWDTISREAINGYQYVECGFSPDPHTSYMTVAGSNSAIARSADNGNTWAPLYPLNGAIQTSLFIIDTMHAFATDNNGNLLRSTDGLQTWYPVYHNSLNYSFTGIWFVSPQKGFLTDEESEIFVTNDGGNSWNLIPFNGAYIYDTFHSVVKFFSSQVGFMTNGDASAAGSPGATFITLDGGSTWQLSYPIGGGSIEFTGDSNVIIAGYGGAILRSAVRGGKIDSFSVVANGSCGVTLSAGVGAALGTVDSIRFLITDPGGRSIFVTANPSTVQDNRTLCAASITHLRAGEIYTAQLAYRFNGVESVSDTIQFVNQGIPTPYIFDSAGLLVSSAASGNQWYYNGNAISGATNRELRPGSLGVYTVQIRLDSCSSDTSAPYSLHASALGVVIAPNPAHNQLNLFDTEYRSLEARILDLTGRTLLTIPIYPYTNDQVIDISNLAPGDYILNVTDAKNHQTGNLLFLKL